MNPFEVTLAAVVEASVSHTAACVPECTVCYPPASPPATEESDD